MIETSGVIEKEQGNGFYLVTLEQPAGHQCLCRAAGKLTKFRIKLLAGDKVLVEISPYDLTRGRITYRERNAGAPGGRRLPPVPSHAGAPPSQCFRPPAGGSRPSVS